MLAPLRVSVPLPTFVTDPPVPEMAPSNVVLVESPTVKAPPPSRILLPLPSVEVSEATVCTMLVMSRVLPLLIESGVVVGSTFVL